MAQKISQMTEQTTASMTEAGTSDFLGGYTATGGNANRKFSLSGLANYFLNKFKMTLGGSSQTVKSAIDALNSKLTVKTKEIPGVTINANDFADQKDLTLKNKPIVGYELTYVASKNVSVLALMCNSTGLTIRIKNNGSEQITTGTTTVYYLDI